MIQVTRDLHTRGPCMCIAEGQSMTDRQTNRQSLRTDRQVGARSRSPHLYLVSTVF